MPRDPFGTLVRAKRRRNRRCRAYATAYTNLGLRGAQVELALALEADRLVRTLQGIVLPRDTVGATA